MSNAHATVLSKIATEAPPCVTNEDGSVNYGVFKGRIAKANVEPHNLPFPFWGPLRNMRLKTWQFHALETDEVYVTMAILHAGYATKAVFLLYLKHSGEAWALDETAPLNFGLQSLNESSIDAATPMAYSFRGNRITMTYIAAERWVVTGKLSLHSLADHSRTRSCEFDITFMDAIGSRDQLSLVFPMTSLSPAYTHKAMGLDTSGLITLGGCNRYALQDFRGSLDWSKLYAPYLTRWRWLFVSGKTKSGENFGINFSSEDHYAHCENAIWINGSLKLAGPIRFVLPEKSILEDEKDKSEWTIHSSENTTNVPVTTSVLLSFTPEYKKKVVLEAGVVESQYMQVLGHISGTITIDTKTYVIEKVFGIAERQLCMW